MYMGPVGLHLKDGKPPKFPSLTDPYSFELPGLEDHLGMLQNEGDKCKKLKEARREGRLEEIQGKNWFKRLAQRCKESDEQKRRLMPGERPPADWMEWSDVKKCAWLRQRKENEETGWLEEQHWFKE